MAVKKKEATKTKAKDGLDPNEIEKAFNQHNDEVRRRDASKERDLKAASVKDKKTVQKRVEQNLKNDLVKVQVADPKIPLEHDHISATAIEGLMDYVVEGTHLRLLCLADPSATPTLEQRVAMAKRLLEVGPFLPRYIKHIEASRKLSVEKEEPRKPLAEEQAEFGIDKNHHPKAPEPTTSSSQTSGVRKVTPSSSPAVVNGVPLKKICAELDIDPKDARRALRSSKIEKPGGRWEWPKDQVDAVKEAIKKGVAELDK